MASGSPRARIDQFFASKKRRKSISPSLKSKKVEKDAKISIEGSPNTKGSLDNFLVGSQENKNPFGGASDSASKRVPIKRNLTLEISLSSNDGKKDSVLPNKGHSEGLDLSGQNQKLRSEISNDIGNSLHGGHRDVPETVHTGEVENPELKQFATDFFSLYCSDLPCGTSLPPEPNVQTHKRHSSTLQLELESTSHKRSCSAKRSQRYVEFEDTCSKDVNIEPLQSTVIGESHDAIFKHSRELSLGDDEKIPRSSLKKCVNASLAVDAVACNTPGSLTSKLKHLETPNSGCGISIFSPGDTFWKEAIQVADDLLAPTDIISSQVAEVSEDFKTNKDLSASNDLQDGDCSKNANILLGGGAAGDSNSVIFSSVGAVSKRGNDLSIEVSPLPIRHFDFSFEDKNLDGEAASNTNTRELRIIKGKILDMLP